MTIKHLLNPPFPSDPRTPPWDQLPWVDVWLNQHKSTRVKKNSHWLVVYLPLWKNDGVCQLGWWLFPIYGKSQNSCSKPPTRSSSLDSKSQQLLPLFSFHLRQLLSPLSLRLQATTCEDVTDSQKGSEKGYHRNMSAPPTLLVCFD